MRVEVVGMGIVRKRGIEHMGRFPYFLSFWHLLYRISLKRCPVPKRYMYSVVSLLSLTCLEYYYTPNFRRVK